MKRVLRGGSWYRTPDLLRVAIRSRTDPNFCYDGVGFRVMRKDGAGRALRGGSGPVWLCMRSRRRLRRISGYEEGGR